MLDVIRGAAVRRRILFITSIVTALLVSILGAATVFAICGAATSYVVTNSAPPPIGNWTDSTGAVWQPSGGFPGCAPGASASDTNGSPTTLIVNTPIPNPITGLTLTCPGCGIVVTSGGSLTLAGNGTIASGAGIFVQSGGTLTVANGGTLTMQSGSNFNVTGGLVDVQSGGLLDLQNSSTVTSSGTLQLSGGTLDATNNVTFSLGSTVSVTSGGTISGGTITSSDNTASVNVSGGTLSLQGGTGDVPFTVASGAAIDVPSGTYTLTTKGTVSGGGTLSVSGGTLSIGGVTSPNAFSMNSGTLTGSGFLSANVFDFHGGTITGSGGTQLNGSGTGTFDGANGTMLFDGRSFNNYGSLTFSATTNPLTLDNGAAFGDYGTMILSADGTIDAGSGGGTFSVLQNGLLWKSGGAGTFTISAPFANDASTTVTSGMLLIAGAGTSSGSFDAEPGAVLAFDAPGTTLNGSAGGGGTYSFPSGSTSFNGSSYSVGTTDISGGLLTFFASGDTNVLNFSSGTLGIASNMTFTVNTSGTWSSGTIQGSGRFDVGSAATFTLDGANGNMSISGIEFCNDGTVNYTAPAPNELTTTGALIENNGLFDIQTDQPIMEVFGGGSSKAPTRRKIGSDALIILGSSSIQNNGTFQKSAGSGTTSIDPAFTNAGIVKALLGTMNFTTSYTQTAGSTTLGAGNISDATTLQLSGGVLDGAGTVTADVQNDANVAPGSASTTGTITITGNYTQGSTGDMKIKLAGPSAYDIVAVSGTSTLDGTLDVSLINGYQPANGAVFPVHTFASRSGDFATKNLPTYGAFGSITATYTPTELDLNAVVAPNADLQITKNGPAGVSAGQNITYTITVTNNGPSAAANVVVSDPTPAGVTFVGNSGACTGAYPCNLGTLALNQTATITSTYSTPPSLSGNVTNTAMVSSTTADGNNTNNSATATTNVGEQADLSIVKTGPASAVPGQQISYTLTIRNNGPSDASNVVVSDPTPAGLAFASNSGACTTAFPCAIGTLTAGQTTSITSTYNIPANYSGASISNTASVSSAVNDPNSANDSSLATTSVTQQADLGITKSGPPSASPGQLITYTVTVTNLGPSTASGVVVNDATPAGLTFVSNAGACTTPYPCSIATPIPSGQSATITSMYNIPANYAGTSVTNTASVSGTVSDTNGTNNSSTVTTPVQPSADLSIVKTGPASFTPGQNVVYTIAVTNNGPLSASNVFVTDPTPAGLGFVSNSGACSGPFPCAIGTLASNQSATITSTFSVPAGYSGASISNTASVSSSTNDANATNDSSTATTPLATGGSIDLLVQKSGPSDVFPNSQITFQVAVANNSSLTATNITVADPTPAGLTFVSNSGACATTFPCTIASLAPHQTVTINATYVVQASGGAITNTATVSSAAPDPQSSNNTSSFTTHVNPPPQCPANAPQLLTPLDHATVSSPLTLSWSAIPNAISYGVIITGNGPPITISTTAASASVTLPNGQYNWSVSAFGAEGCDPKTSAHGVFTICTPPTDPPKAGIPGQMTTGQNFTLEWNAVDGANTYEVQEASDPGFGTLLSTSTTGATQKTFAKQVNVPTPFWYRVRAVAICDAVGPWSEPVGIVVVPVPGPHDVNPSVNVPVGSTKPVTWQIFIPGLPGITTSFFATTDKPWISILPVSGIVGPEGVLLTISLDPSHLENGTWTGTVLVVYGSGGVSSRVHTDGSAPTTAIPVSVNVVTPVTPQPLTGASQSALVVPSLGFLANGGSTWRSDIRLANIGALTQKYQLLFNNGSSSMKSTTLTVDGGSTLALDDFVRNWFGVGPLGDSANGSLTIQALDANGKPLLSNIGTVVSSRTFNAVGASTLGQFIPATPFSSFITHATSGAPSILTLQQIAQSNLFRTNLGLVEGANKAASVVVSVFNGSGTKLTDIPVSLKAGEQKQLNSFLAANGITLTNGHVEVQVTNGDGRVTAYASVIDSQSSDPFFVAGVPLGATTANRFVVPGVAEVESSSANWRSDLRVFNGGNAPQNATLTFYPSADASNSVSQQITINPGEVKALDNVLQSAFGVTNAGGVLHVTTDNNAPLVVTARTYNQTSGGSVGQFIPAITPAQSVGSGDRALQVLQLEDSPRYRTNIGIAEVTGKPAVAEIAVVLPDSKVSPIVQVPLGAYEFVQLPVLSSLGIGNVYNARISVRVIDGAGKVTAYGSVIDRNTSDATYVPAQ